MSSRICCNQEQEGHCEQSNHARQTARIGEAGIGEHCGSPSSSISPRYDIAMPRLIELAGKPMSLSVESVGISVSSKIEVLEGSEKEASRRQQLTVMGALLTPGKCPPWDILRRPLYR